MNIEFDDQKNLLNIRQHGLDFDDIKILDWDNAQYKIDNRKKYGEERWQAFVYGQDEKPYVVVFTLRNGKVRIISFRRARERERKKFNA